MDKDLLSRQQARECVQRAFAAFEQLQSFSQEKIDRICRSIRDAGMAHAARLGEMAAAETGFGNPTDKKKKNEFAADRVYNAISSMKTIGILSENQQEGILDIAVPVGVIAAIVPSTNPTSTVIYKALIALKGGNTIVFSPHPSAARCTLEAAKIVAAAAEQAGCPAGAICCIETPTPQACDEMMRHPLTRLILATGGPGMLKAAYSSGKPAIGVGAGNGPCYIHASADVRQAVADVIASKTFDYGTVCASEQSLVLERKIADQVRTELKAQGGYFLSETEAGKVAAILLKPNGSINPKIVGKSAVAIAEMAGFQVPSSTRVLVAHETQAGPTRPYSREKLCPILALFELEDESAVLEKAIEVLSHEGSGHTFAMHCKDDAVIRRFALKIPVSRFLVNTPAALGGIGETTSLFPALTLGCGAIGGSSSSNNISPMDLINIRRVAVGKTNNNPQIAHTTTTVSDELIERLAEQILKKLQ